MKTPEEIKKGLECGDCKTCPYSERNNNDGDNHCGEVAADALAYIRRLEEKAPKWISVEERLPGIDEDVLLFTNEGVSIGFYNAFFDEWTDFVQVDMERVTHWMPLPEQPEV